MSDDDKTEAPAKDSGKAKGKGKDGEKKKSPMLLIMLLVLGLVGGIGVSKVMGGGGGPAVEPPPEPGEIANIEAININLAEGRFLRVAVGAQLTKKVPEKGEAWVKIEGAKVRDAMIRVFSGKTVAVIQSTEGREELVRELEELVVEATEKQVMKVYLAEYVSQ
jgi:flagellar FliL protein